MLRPTSTARGILLSAQSHGQARIVPASQELFDRGYELYAKREDKDWSLTD